MPRRRRVLVEGATYHVYARVTRREAIFADPAEAGAWLEVVRSAKRRDGFVVLAWCLMTNHFHLVLRTGPAPLWRSMRSIQGRYAAGFNRRHRFLGPVWQSRYKAKLVTDDSYLRRLLAYVHLNPVAAGVVTTAESYAHSGHREIVGKVVAGLADPDEVLRLFGETRRSALRLYQEALRVVATELHQRGGTSGVIEWNVESDFALGTSGVPGLDALGRSPGRDRRLLGVDAFVREAARTLGLSLEELSGVRQHAEVVRAREAVALVGTERYGLRLKALAEAMRKSPESASRWVAAAALRRRTDPQFASLLERLDAGLATPEASDLANSGVS